MVYLSKKNNELIFGATKLILTSSSTWKEDISSIHLLDAKAHTQVYFNNYTNDFYFFSYNDIKDFQCRVLKTTVSSSDYANLDHVTILTHNETPLEFIEEAELIKIDILENTKYAYYTVYQNISNITYHGILDLEKILLFITLIMKLKYLFIIIMTLC